ncbi:MAG: HEAT repeat domain-containing protein, partial [Candidatus Krumholzibacteria bacterium]|nr:HEAT repeat domain-containing protein [Candidatus Krumholzibacteria bacterium]
SAAIGCIAEHGGADERRLVDDQVIERLMVEKGPEGQFARVQVAEALGVLKDPFFKKYLMTLLDDSSPHVVDSAMHSAGRLAHRSFVPKLLERLADKRYRKGARESLAAYGDRIVGTLSDYVSDPSFDLARRGHLCRVLSRIPSQLAVDTLLSTINQVEPELRYHVIKALNSLRAHYPQLSFGHRALNGALLEETETYYAILQILHIGNRADDEGGKLLLRALQERIDQSFERIFRLLGLSYSQKDIYGAYLGITGDKKELNASAVEFLDNVLKKEVKRFLFPIVDSITVDLKIRKGQELFGIDIADRNQALEYLIKGRDPWLKACAIFAIRDNASSQLRELAKAGLEDPNPVVRETAILVVEQWAS